MAVVQYNYHCKHSGCPHFVKTVVIEKDEEFKSHPEECEGCGNDLYCFGQRTTYFVHSSRTPAETQQMLRKRSRDHYKPNKDEWHQKNTKDFNI